jgi:hypothetical protein
MTELDVNEEVLRRTLKTVAERTPIASGDEAFFTGGPVRVPHRSRRLLTGAVAGVILVAAVGVAIVYGPRSANVPGSGSSNENAASTPVVRTSWVVSIPVGYTAFKSDAALQFGVQSLSSASYRRPGLRRAGWRSGVLEVWAPTALVRSGHPYSDALTITLRIDQFGSPKEASRYQRKTYNSYRRNSVGTSSVRSSLPRGADAEALSSTPTTGIPAYQFVVWLRRGPYDVEIGGGQRHFSEQFERLIERLARSQYDRIPH